MILRSFYARLSLLFLLLILLLGGASLIIAFNASGHLFDEVEQLLNREYAASIALELKPIVDEGYSEGKIQEAIHYMMVLNPMVEIYLLDHRGEILSYFTHPHENLSRSRIDLSPLRQFIDSGGLQAVQGDDPRTEKAVKPFSAAQLKMGPETGWVYVILRGQGYDRSLAMLSSSYYLRSGLSTFIIAMLATVAAGLFIFFLLTQKLRALSMGVKAFQQGKFDHRVKIRGNDELGTLGRAFNDMAESIEEGIEQLHQAETQRGELIANISHDLRSPLTSIRGYLETILLKDRSLTEGERKEFIEISLKNISSFQKLVEELFDLAKLESRQIKPEWLSFSLAELLQDVVLKLKPLSDKLGISMNYEPAALLPSISGDIGLIERVLTNILENALYHTPAGGKIKISLQSRESSQHITVADSGPGISMEDLPHLFERFYRADKSRNRETPGTGLGLAIAKEVVELHGGRIEAQSPEGGGAVFTIILPQLQNPEFRAGFQAE